MKLDTGITVFPFLHGRASFARELRTLCLSQHFDCIAVDIPEFFEPYLSEITTHLPLIHAIIANQEDGECCYLPADPCDTTIEAIRQSFQMHIPFRAIGFPTCKSEPPFPVVPDDYALHTLGSEAFDTLCLTLAASVHKNDEIDMRGSYLAYRLSQLKPSFKSILAVLHLRHITSVKHHFCVGNTVTNFPERMPIAVTTAPINPEHLYFALGELPFVTAIYERERYDIIAEPFDPLLSIKDLFRETRETNGQKRNKLSPVRLQAGLTFLRNLTVLDHRLLPSLFDIVEAAKGVGGNQFALEILKQAKYYPWLSFDNTVELLDIGIDKIRVPVWNKILPAHNLFRDQEMEWRAVSLRPDPSELRKTKYRYQWNPYGMCSHVPEDITIERFNGRIRQKALSVLVEDHVKTEQFVSSVKDGIDIRETLRNWHEKHIYVRELPPSRAKLDTVIIIFDGSNDEQYPHCTTWYAEHEDESTLSFYATAPYGDLIGPGIARCTYGGLVLLFPPRQIPDIFTIQSPFTLPDLRSRLTYGALVNSNERVVAFVSHEKPDAFIVNLAHRCGKKLVWIPLSTFSRETINRLRTFHILNGKSVRSWATRFIGEE